ncbi:hypothetical protein CUMW_008000 [Citrus unshiu]|nr:hypothetical protein CUMW_008000 [Citrus unshiu]
MNFGVGSVKLLLSLLLLLFAHLFLLIGLSDAQNNTTTTTDPAEEYTKTKDYFHWLVASPYQSSMYLLVDK